MVVWPTSEMSPFCCSTTMALLSPLPGGSWQCSTCKPDRAAISMQDRANRPHSLRVVAAHKRATHTAYKDARGALAKIEAPDRESVRSCHERQQYEERARVGIRQLPAHAQHSTVPLRKHPVLPRRAHPATESMVGEA